MAYNFVRANSDYLRSDSVGAAAKPVTISAWFRRTEVTGIQAGVYLGDPTQATTRIALGRTSATLRLMDRGGTAAVNADGAANGLPASGTWYHAAGAYLSATSRTPHLNGSAGSTITTDCGAQVPYTRTSIGRMDQSSFQDAFDGDIAEVAIWDVILSGADLAALAAGDSPLSLATAPVRYWRLKEDGDLTCLVSGQVLTVSGATWTSDHPVVDDPPDTTPPTVDSVSPLDTATGVAVDTVVTATFDEAMDPATIDDTVFTLTPSGGSPVAASVAASVGDTVFTLTPSADLEHDTVYDAEIGTGAEDVAGNALAAPEAWSFTTEEAPPSVGGAGMMMMGVG